MPGMLIGFTLGAVVGELTSLRIAARRAIAIGPPAIIVGGIFLLQPNHPWFLLVLDVPMLACSLYLEQRTRRSDLALGVTAPALGRSGAAALGTVIATCNTMFIAVALGFQLGRDAGILVLQSSAIRCSTSTPNG